jgi:RNA polymerase sigma factor (sigma-70 family)
MATSQMSRIIRHLRSTVQAGLTDGQLLEGYLSRRDEGALAALVRRHAPMVWGVCRRLLCNYHDAEDAFQATFLVLVRKAASIARRELLANWLYGVARQTAIKARAIAAKRCARERQVVDMPEPAVVEQDLRRDLDEELSRLPDKYRAVIVLCDLEGKTRKEVAQQLGVPDGTVASRMATARRMLAKRLTQRGVPFSGGALAAVLSEKVASASVPTSVVSSTIKTASLVAAGQAAGVISVNVAALTEGVLKTMFVTKLKAAMVVMLLVALLGSAAGLVYQTQAADLPKSKTATKSADKADADVPRLQEEVKRLREENEELKKRLQQAVRKGKVDDVKLVVKVYSVAPLLLRDSKSDLPGDTEAQPLIRAITKTIEPTSWSEMGGNGSVEYVRPAGSIIVRQTPAIQEQVQHLLDALEKNRMEQAKGEQEKKGA